MDGELRVVDKGNGEAMVVRGPDGDETFLCLCYDSNGFGEGVDLAGLIVAGLKSLGLK